MNKANFRIFSLGIFIFLFVLPMTGQSNKGATLYFRNGTDIKGFAIITNKQKIKFRKELNSKNIVYTNKEIDSIRIKVNKWPGYEINTYHYKTFGKKNKPILLKPITYGKVTLYLHKSLDRHSGVYNNKNYYVSKENMDSVTHLGRIGPLKLFDKNIINEAIEYFKDCPELVKKIQAREYKKRDIVEIVEYYNEHCE
ncbi:hypothetical protein UMM65_02905 [Aureibaculum sp. 2210JD6-5]|uniref:hypothetical protein n=1 Tax=Aureibaculum sp. 2210JD6-5 TaxID=3103957 RepID=UPI002AAE2586|nr:hypothetical protein [Aureibaculum sp. 2210JD6-5]MDY7394176.1 hypothetical protein [Aureibaculum sp. 2210JD6-5]